MHFTFSVTVSVRWQHTTSEDMRHGIVLLICIQASEEPAASFFRVIDPATDSSETSVSVYQTERHHIPEESNLPGQCHKNLKSSHTASIEDV
jgi:hypothetical protein